MTKVSILANGFSIYKSRAFFLPIVRFSEEIESAGINLEIVYGYSDIDDDCEVVIVEDNSILSENDVQSTVSILERLKNRSDQILWFDTTDSTGTIRREIFRIVDKYYKKQILSNRHRYCERISGTRLYSDYYYENYEISNSKFSDEPQIKSESQLDKLGVSWNLGYEVYLPMLDGALKNGLFRGIPRKLLTNFPWGHLIAAPPIWASADRSRETPVSGRFSTSFDDAAVQFHRKLFANKAGHQFDSTYVNSVQYWRELRNSKVLLSPFGWGEICHRDFEGFLSGCLVVKPRMDHLDTWPPLYEDGETMLAVDWDLEDLEGTIEWALNNDAERKSIADEGQARYKRYLVGDSAADEFVNKFLSIVRSV